MGHRRAQKGNRGKVDELELRYSKTQRKVKEVQLGFRTYYSEMTELRNG